MPPRHMRRCGGGSAVRPRVFTASGSSDELRDDLFQPSGHSKHRVSEVWSCARPYAGGRSQPILNQEARDAATGEGRYNGDSDMIKRYHSRLARRSGALAAAGILVAAAPGLGQTAERVTLSGERVSIHNLAGEVRVERGSGSDVVVTATRGGADAARLTFETRTLEGIETLIIRYPGDEVVYPRMDRGSRTQVTVAEDGRLSEGDRRVRVRGSGGGLEAYVDLRIAVPAGKDVAVHHGVGEVEVTGVEADLLIDVSTGPVRATGTRGALNLDTGSGSIVVSDVIGDLRVDTGSGSVAVTDVTGDVVLIDTGSGSVDATDIQSTRLSVDTGSGDIELASIRAEEISLDTGSGSVEVDLLSAVSSLEIDTGSGDVVVRLPADLDAEIEVETGSGGIDVDFPLTVSEVERTHLVGRIGDGRGRIHIDTGSGSVRLLRR